MKPSLHLTRRPSPVLVIGAADIVTGERTVEHYNLIHGSTEEIDPDLGVSE